MRRSIQVKRPDRDTKTPTESVTGLPKLAGRELETLRQQALQHFFPGVVFASASGLGGLRLAHTGALAVSIVTNRSRTPRFYFGMRLDHVQQIAQADLAFLLMCGVIAPEDGDTRCLFFAVPVRVFDDEVLIAGQAFTVSEGGHYNLNVVYQGEWILRGMDADLPLERFSHRLGSTFVPAHMREAPTDLVNSALPTTITGLRDCREYAALVSASDPLVEIVCTLRRKEPV